MSSRLGPARQGRSSSWVTVGCVIKQQGRIRMIATLSSMNISDDTALGSRRGPSTIPGHRSEREASSVRRIATLPSCQCPRHRTADRPGPPRGRPGRAAAVRGDSCGGRWFSATWGTAAARICCVIRSGSSRPGRASVSAARTHSGELSRSGPRSIAPPIPIPVGRGAQWPARSVAIL